MPKETVTIKGVEYEKNSPYIAKDCFIEDGYVHLQDDYYNYFIVDRIENKRILTLKKVSYKNPMEIYTVRVKSMVQNAVTIHFHKRVDLDNFLVNNKLVFNEDTYYYYYEDEVGLLVRLKPRGFDFVKKPITISQIENYTDFNKGYQNSTEYKELLDFIKLKNTESGIDSYTFLETEGIRHTFGVEVETISGSFKDSEVHLLNLKAVHDGSLRDPDGSGPWGKEYVTGVLKGDSGFNHLQQIMKTISSKCTIDDRASVHVHIGSLEWNSEEIVMCYLLGEILEDELFSMMPSSRNDNAYCKKLKKLTVRNKALLKIAKTKKDYKKSIDKLYLEIFKEVARTAKPGREYNKNTVSPEGPHGGWDRDRSHRYKWLNFTNIIFNQRGSMDYKTIEFRNHSATLSYKKIRNWIKICMAFVEFVHNNKSSIINKVHKGSPITIESIIMEAYPKTGKNLVDYVNERKVIFSSPTNQKIDYTESIDNDFKSKKELIRCV